MHDEDTGPCLPDEPAALIRGLAYLIQKPVQASILVANAPLAVLRGPLTSVETIEPDDFLAAAVWLHLDDQPQGIRLMFQEQRLVAAEWHDGNDRMVIETTDQVRVEVRDQSPEARLRHWRRALGRAVNDHTPGANRRLSLLLAILAAERDQADDLTFRLALEQLHDWAATCEPPPPEAPDEPGEPFEF